MTKVTIYKNEFDECVGFRAYGHAGYDDEGYDIVCAAISVLTINTMNAIEAFTEEEIGYYDLQFFLVKDIESEQFPIIGYKIPSSENITWTKDR